MTFPALKRLHLSSARERGLALTTAALAALWCIDLLAPGGWLSLRLVIAGTGVVASWRALSGGLEPALTDLRLRPESLHSLGAAAALALTSVTLALHALGRLPENLLTPRGTPVVFLDIALLAQICAALGRSSSQERALARATAFASRPRTWAAAAILAAGLAFAVWSLSADAPGLGVRAAIAVLLASDPLLIGNLRRAALVSGACSLGAHGVHLAAQELLPRLAELDLALFQKRGVLTRRRARVTDVISFCEDRRPQDILRLAAAAEFGVAHPLRDAILRNQELEKGTLPSVKGFEHLPSRGVRAFLQGRELLCGNLQLMTEQGWTRLGELEERSRAVRERGDTALFVALGEEVLGMIAVHSSVRSDAAIALQELRELGVGTGALSGDDGLSVSSLCRQLGEMEVLAGLEPSDAARSVGDQVQRGRRTAVIATRDDYRGALACATAGIEWPAHETPDAPGSDDGDNVVALTARDLRCVSRLVEAGRAYLRRSRAALILTSLLHALAWSAVGGAFHPFLGGGPNPLLAGFLFILSWRHLGSRRPGVARQRKDGGVRPREEIY